MTCDHDERFRVHGAINSCIACQCALEAEFKTIAQKAFKELREKWFNSHLKRHRHERDWDPDRDDSSRERNNKASRDLFDSQTELILEGEDLPIAPRSDHEMHEG